MACVLVPPGVTVAVPIQVLFCNTAVASDISKVQPGSVDVSTTAATSGINGIIGADAVNTARDEGKGDSSRVCFPGLVVSVGAGAKLHLKQSYHTLTLTPRPSSSSSTIDYAIDTADMVAPTMAKAEREEGSASTHSPLTEPSPNIVVGAECAAATDPQQSPLTVNSPGMVVAGTTVWLGEKAVFTHTYVQDLAGTTSSHSYKYG